MVKTKQEAHELLSEITDSALELYKHYYFSGERLNAERVSLVIELLAELVKQKKS